MLHFDLRWVGSEIEPLAFRASMVRSPPTDKPIVVFTRCDRITGGIRKALLSSAPLTFAESEQTLHQHAARGARLVVLHANGGLTASRAAGRLLRAVPDLAAPIVGLSDTATSGMVGAVQAELMNDLLQTRFERWLVLLQAWLGHPQGARQRVSELRLLHACAPARILPLLDPLMLVPDSELSVKR